MIKITEYKQMLADMLADINLKQPADRQVNIVPILSADETSFSKKLAETTGIIVGGQYPSVDVNNAEENAVNPTHPCLLFILEKRDLSTMTDAELDLFYEQIGELADELMLCISCNEYACSLSDSARFGGNFHFEWEYNYSGFYGCSISFNLI